MKRKTTLKKEIPEENVNPICVDCANDCRQEASVAILTCPQKIKRDEQLELFTKTGKARKAKDKDKNKDEPKDPLAKYRKTFIIEDKTVKKRKRRE